MQFRILLTDCANKMPNLNRCERVDAFNAITNKAVICKSLVCRELAGELGYTNRERMQHFVLHLLRAKRLYVMRSN